MKRQYLKQNFRFWSVKKINKYSEKIWYSVIILMTLTVLWALARNYTDNLPKADPRASVVSQVIASEPVKISCEDPKGYLECAMYNGKLTAQEYRIMEAIAEAESKFNPNATQVNIHKDGSTSIDRGIFQLNHRYQKAISNQDAFDFKKNIDYAIKLMKRSGYTQWAVYNNGSYIKYLND